jgi:hypothetical protein
MSIIKGHSAYAYIWANVTEKAHLCLRSCRRDLSSPSASHAPCPIPEIGQALTLTLVTFFVTCCCHLEGWE